MHALILQLQLLLAALSAFLPLLPADARSRAGAVLDIAAKTLAAGGAVAANLDDLARKLAAIRAEVEAMAARPLDPAELDAAFARLDAARAGFHAALAAGEQTP